ncbi:DUF6064 family protein [Rhizobacter sp. P5_C2]
MSEWWTYRPSSFLMFSPRIYGRLFESLNEAWWPLQWAVMAVASAWLVWRARGGRDERMLRAAFAFVALCWAFTAWAFLLERFAPIFWPAMYFAAAFGLQAVGLLVLAWRGGVGLSVRRWRVASGTALAAWAVFGHPWVGLLLGRPWRQAGFFGLAPDPTVLATLALLLLVAPTTAAARRGLRLLWVLPLAWCAISAALLATMASSRHAGVSVERLDVQAHDQVPRPSGAG